MKPTTNTYLSHTHTTAYHLQETQRNTTQSLHFCHSALPSACHQLGSLPGPLRDHGWQLVPPALVRRRRSLVVLKWSSCPKSSTSSGWYVPNVPKISRITVSRNNSDVNISLPELICTCSIMASMMKAPSKSPGALRVWGYIQGLKET